jgi:peptide/nickel transport system substrate-binding protein
MSHDKDQGDLAKGTELDHLVESMERGALTREAFIARAGALGLSASAIGALLGNPSLAAASRARPSARAATGVLRVVDNGNGTADTIDPHKQAAPIDGMRITSLYDKLVVFTDKWKPVPWLAESIESTKDAKTWTIRLRKGVTFHDGQPLTATDVKFTFDSILDPKIAAANVNNFGFLKGAVAQILDPLTLRYKLKAPFADAVAAFGDPSGTNIISHTFDPTKANNAPNGTGPFKFVSFTAGQSSVMTKNENYWNSKYPLVNELHIQDVPDESARVNALGSGQADLVTNLSYSQINPVKAAGGQVVVIPGNILNVICLVPDVAPETWKNKLLRQAFAISIDRKQIVDVVYRGLATVGNDQPIGPTYYNGPVGIPVPKRNIPRAKQLLAKAGHPNGLDATMFTGAASQGMLDFAQVIQQQVKEAGIRLKLHIWPSDSFWSDVWLKKDFYTSAWTQRATPQLFLAETAYSHGTYNESHYRDADVDKWLTKAVQTTDHAKRVKYMSLAMAKVSDSAQWIVPAYGSLVHASTKSFKWTALPPASSAPYLYNASV